MNLIMRRVKEARHFRASGQSWQACHNDMMIPPVNFTSAYFSTLKNVFDRVLSPA
jgi:hypothetical protein